MSDFIRYRLRKAGDFVTVSGKVKPIYGCCFDDIEEFLERVEHIRLSVANQPEAELGHEPLSFEQLLSTDNLLQYSVQRCLEMHGLSMKDVGIRHIQDLLLFEVVDGAIQPGLLLRVNSPRDQATVEAVVAQQLGKDKTAVDKERALAILATYTKSVTEAIELTKMMTMAETHSLIEATSALYKKAESEAKGLTSSSAKEQYSTDASFAASVDKYARPSLEDILAQ